MMDLPFVERHDPSMPPWADRGIRILGPIWRRLGRITIRVEGRGNLPAAPCLLATNGTHRYDIVPIRYLWMAEGRRATTYCKGKNYHGLLMRAFCRTLGSIPLASRGYLVTTDFLALHGRRPDDAEYRVLRDVLDRGEGLPSEPVFRAFERQPRSILGRPFDPSTEPWHEAMGDLYHRMALASLSLSRRALAEGHDLHVYPQGTSSSRLSEGRIGTVQLARALDLPVVPVGFSGSRDFFRWANAPISRRSTVTLRIGTPFRPPLGDLPDDFRPFSPEDERRHRAPLRIATEALMDRIDALLDPEYRLGPDRRSDGSAGVARFL